MLRAGKFIYLKIQTLYLENLTIEEVAGLDPPSNGSPYTDDFRKSLSGFISRNSRSVWLKIRTFYQENITIEEVARQEPPSSFSPDTEYVRINFEQEYLGN